MSRPPLLWLLIGPNGAGKSTYYATRVAPHVAAEFVNADLIQAERAELADVEGAYEAARIAATRRAALLQAGTSFVTETVASHPSKLELVLAAQAAGYEVWVSFIYVESADLCVARVARRVRHGGHPVPEHKVRERYERMAPIAAEALRRCDRGFVLDNSDTPAPLRDVAIFERGRPTWRAKACPAWAFRILEELREL